MGHAERNKLVFTIKDKCRVCYTCVRECPVKAIKINNGQAEVISERCIGCGNCVKVCSQGAKVFLDSKSEVGTLLSSEKKVIACIAPSFPAEFSDIKDYQILVGMIKRLGFNKVVEVAFGADLIASEYRQMIDSDDKKPYISSDCPSIVYYIEHYHPNLVQNLAPIASPMVAVTRVIRKEYGDVKVVFIGPCIAKKAESDEVDEGITFKELRELFQINQIKPEDVIASDFDPPRSGKGAVFPVDRGLIQAIDKNDDLTDGRILTASGKDNFKEIISEFESGEIDCKYMELLCCKGCIMGPGMTNKNQRYLKRNLISSYVQQKMDNFDQEEWQANIDKYSNLDLSQSFNPSDRRELIPSSESVNKVLVSMGKKKPSDFLNCGACGYNTCKEHAIAIVQGHAETEMCLPFAIEKLHKSIEDLNISNGNLEDARIALKQSEKLANMGQLSAGIAHELNNPLGVITMYSNILKEETTKDNPMYHDLELIVDQTERCKKIVGGLLNFARKNQVKKAETNIEKFVIRSTESIVIPQNVKLKVVVDLKDPIIMIDQDQMMQVLTNLEKNAIEAMPDGGMLTVKVVDNESNFQVHIQDTGIGIPKENMEKLFTPFFTTKQLGKGTGLGLPLVYGIVKMHKGQINVISNTDENNGATGTTFIIDVPKF